MLVDVRNYGICAGATVARFDGCSVTCEEVGGDGMLDIDSCCISLPHREKSVCPELEDQVDCGPCGSSSGCGCDGGGEAGGEPAELTAEQLLQVESVVTDCVDAQIVALNSLDK